MKQKKRISLMPTNIQVFLFIKLRVGNLSISSVDGENTVDVAVTS